MATARAMFDAGMHPRGARGRFARSAGLSGGERYLVARPSLNGKTREARLKKAATENHDRKIAWKAAGKGTASTPLSASFRKARREFGSQPRRHDLSRSVLGEHAGTWVRLNWDKVPSRVGKAR